MTVWILIFISANWRVCQQIAYHNYSFHTLTYSVSMVFQIVGILWEVFSISIVQLQKNSIFTLAYRNAPMKSNWCTPVLLLEESANKYFILLIDAVWYQVSPIISLFWKSPLTTILNFNLSTIPSDWILTCRNPCMVSLNLPSLDHRLEISDCWLKFYLFQSCFQQILFGIFW